MNSEPQLHCGTCRKERKFSFAFSSTHYCQKRARKKKHPGVCRLCYINEAQVLPGSATKISTWLVYLSIKSSNSWTQHRYGSLRKHLFFPALFQTAFFLQERKLLLKTSFPALSCCVWIPATLLLNCIVFWNNTVPAGLMHCMAGASLLVLVLGSAGRKLNPGQSLEHCTLIHCTIQLSLYFNIKNNLRKVIWKHFKLFNYLHD